MNTNELKFLLKLFDCSDRRAYLASPIFRNFPDKEIISQKLAADGLIDFSQEISAVFIAPPGSALLNLPIQELPISDIEFRILDRINRYPGIQPKQIHIKTKEKLLKTAELHDILHSFHSRGLIFIETELKNQKVLVWLTERGLQCVKKLQNYFESLRKESVEEVDETSTFVPSQVDPPSTETSSKLTDEEILQVIRDLDKELGTDNYLPIFYLRQKLQPPLSREELDTVIYRLQRSDKIELSSLQEGMNYTKEQIDAAINQGIGRRLFFIILN